MLIDEVEAIWSAIAEHDDWAPFEAKIAAVRRMGDAMTSDARRLTGDAPAWERALGVPEIMSEMIVSTEPATGAEIWSGAVGDAAAEVAAARAAWPEWAAHSVTYRMETLRRFANVVRAREDRIRRPDRARDRQAVLGSEDRGRLR